MTSRPTADSQKVCGGSTAKRTNEALKLQCPECGRTVDILDDSLAQRWANTARLAHAACCCYVASMPPPLLRRLIVAVLTMGNGAEDSPDEPLPAGSGCETHT